MVDVSVEIGRLRLKSPVIIASGVFGWGEAFKFFDLKKLGAITTKTITLKPRQGNPQPRLYETVCGLINSIGLENPGLEIFIKEKLPFLKKIGVPIIVSIAGDNKEELLELTRRLDRVEIEAIELNISCPNIKSQIPSQDPNLTYELVKAVRKITNKTLIAKLSPNVTDITEIAKACVKAKIDALSLINTFFALGIDLKKEKIITGGLSGPVIKPIALRMVYEVRKETDISIIGCGGIMNWRDALEFFIAGANAVSLGTANLVNPKVTLEIIKGIKDYLRKNKIRDIKELQNIWQKKID